MTDLFGEATPIDVHITVSRERGQLAYHVGFYAINPETGQEFAIHSHRFVDRGKLGPALARALLRAERILRDSEPPSSAGSPGSS